jgi:hypothetical protein
MKIIFTLFFILNTAFLMAQNIVGAKPATGHTKQMPASKKNTMQTDTVIEKDTTKENQEPQYYYLSVNTDVAVNSRGGFGKRFSPAIEFGRTFGIFDIGLATGRFNCLFNARDTVRYVEFRPTINIFSKGRFAEALCLGGGYVFGAKQGMMTEICNSINFNITEIWAVAVTQGYYYLDGTNNSRNAQYMGFAVTYNFLRKHSTNINRKKKALVSDN